ncbi:nucleotidyltransferase domain-containing protein [Sorangium sp. So ce1335]|uniref:nucleotidyltransferase domain-containing protein n=1 Tax=Sorangium sp. So ce1335 TaxID=3133335 RepID=UPI003F5E9727
MREPNFQAHHLRTVSRLVERLSADPCSVAIIVGGSQAKGLGKETSDVDFCWVVTDEEHARRRARGELVYFANDEGLVDYPGGYVDGKIVTLDFLREVRDRGSEPARAAFLGAMVPWSRRSGADGVEALVRAIATYPEHERAHKMTGFVAQLEAMRYYLESAEHHGNRYLLTWASARAVLFGYRLILAHNRILYPYHKWVRAFVADAPEKPADLLRLSDELLDAPGKRTGEAFCGAVLSFRDWEKPAQWPTRFMLDSELNWLHAPPPLEDA